MSRSKLASKHSHLLLASRSRWHFAAADEGGEVYSTSNWWTSNHHLHPHSRKLTGLKSDDTFLENCRSLPRWTGKRVTIFNSFIIIFFLNIEKCWSKCKLKQTFFNFFFLLQSHQYTFVLMVLLPWSCFKKCQLHLSNAHFHTRCFTFYWESHLHVWLDFMW